MTNGVHFGINNYVSTASASGTASGFSSDNVLTSNGSIWRGADNNETLTITLDADRDIDFVSLHNLKAQYVQCVAKLNTGTVSTQAKNYMDISGLEINSVYFEIDDIIDELVFTIQHFDDSYVEVGYVFAGDSVNIDVQDWQSSDISNDTVSITTGNLANSTRRYLYRTYQITTKKKPETRVKNVMRTIYVNGYASPRPIICAYDCMARDEVLLGILDSPKVQYDYFDANYAVGNRVINIKGYSSKVLEDQAGEAIYYKSDMDEVGQRFAQCTIGITETFGGLEAS